MEKTGVSQKAIIFNGEGKFLVIRRTETATSRPNEWDLPGGDLGFGEDAMEGIAREIKEETGLEVEGLEPFDVESHINSKGEFWVTIAYAATVAFGEVATSFEHNEFRWVAAGEFFQLEAADKLKRFVKKIIG